MSRHKWFKLDAETWLSDPKLRMVSYRAKGIWINIICLCHLSERYGYLVINKQKVSKEMVRKMLNLDRTDTIHFQKLVDVGILRQDEEGFYYCHKLLKDKAFQESQSKFGKKGGNPTLKGSLNPTLKPEKKESKNKSKSKNKEKSINTKKEAEIPENSKSKLKGYKELNEVEFKGILAKYKNEFPDTFIIDFYLYWSEPNSKGKMKFQLEDTWEVKRRLQRWNKNNANGFKTASQIDKEDRLNLIKELEDVNVDEI